MTLLVVVHCYAAEQRRVETFLPWWLHHGADVLLLSPEDAPVCVDHPRVTCRSAGRRGYVGWHTLERQRAHWRLALEYPADWYLLHDADSVALTPGPLPAELLADDRVLWSNDRPDFWPPQPPYLVSRRILSTLHEAFALLRPEQWASDVVVAIDSLYYLMVRQFSIVHRTLPRSGAFMTMGQREAGEDVENLIAAVRAGARYVHHVKDADTLRRLVAIAASEEEVRRFQPDDEDVSETIREYDGGRTQGTLSWSTPSVEALNDNAGEFDVEGIYHA